MFRRVIVLNILYGLSDTLLEDTLPFHLLNLLSGIIFWFRARREWDRHENVLHYSVYWGNVFSVCALFYRVVKIACFGAADWLRAVHWLYMFVFIIAVSGFALWIMMWFDERDQKKRK